MVVFARGQGQQPLFDHSWAGPSTWSWGQGTAWQARPRVKVAFLIHQGWMSVHGRHVAVRVDVAAMALLGASACNACRLSYLRHGVMLAARRLWFWAR